MDEEDGPRKLVWRGGEDGVVAVWVEASDDFGAWRFVDADTRGADGDASVGIDLCIGSLRPNIGPPRTGRGGTKGRAFLAQSQ